MPRGAKRDDPITKLLRKNHLFLDSRSFVGYDSEMKPHIFLKGDDVVCQRQRVYIRGKRACKKCKRPVPFGEWEMDHIQGGLIGRCDCLENLQILCGECHRKKHVRTRFSSAPAGRREGAEKVHSLPPPESSKKDEAEKDFEKLYPKEE